MTRPDILSYTGSRAQHFGLAETDTAKSMPSGMRGFKEGG